MLGLLDNNDLSVRARPFQMGDGRSPYLFPEFLEMGASAAQNNGTQTKKSKGSKPLWFILPPCPTRIHIVPL